MFHWSFEAAKVRDLVGSALNCIAFEIYFKTGKLFLHAPGEISQEKNLLFIQNQAKGLRLSGRLICSDTISLPQQKHQRNMQPFGPGALRMVFSGKSL
jgi:hypothetical protein